MELIRNNTKTVNLAKIRAPGNLRKLVETDSVKEIADSIQKFGMLYPPTINKTTGEIVSGRSRVAAHFLLKRSTIEVCYVTVEQLHARALEIVENLCRRHESKQKQASLARELVQIFEQEEAAKDRKKKNSKPAKRASGNKRGPEASPRRRAVKRAAEATGKSVAAVQRSVQRAAEEERTSEDEKEKIIEEPSVLTFELDVDPNFLLAIRSLQEAIDLTYANLLEAQRRMSRLAKANVPMQVSTQELRRTWQTVAAATKGERPIAICPGCKLIETLTPECSFCLGVGYVTEAQWPHVPEALRSTEHLVVQTGGPSGNAAFVAYDSMFDYDDESTLDLTAPAKPDPSTSEPSDDNSVDGPDLSGMFTID